MTGTPKGKKTKKKKRRWIILFVLVLVVVIAGSQMSRFSGGRDRPQSVRVEPVKRVEKLTSKVSATGQIQAKESVDIQTEIAGIIVDLPVEEGDVVQEGDILIKIDPEQMRTDVRGAEAQLAAAEADAQGSLTRVASSKAELAQSNFQIKSSLVDLEQGKVSLRRSEALLARQKELYETKLISPEEFEIAETQARLDEVRLSAYEAAVEQAKARHEAQLVGVDQAKSQALASKSRSEAARATLERLNDLLKKTTIRSPIGGLIVRRNVDLGERAVPGVLSNPQATLLTIADLTAIEAHIEVDETDIVNVTLGDTVEVLVDALPDDELDGIVTEIGNSPINLGTNEAKDFKVVVQLSDPPGVLRPGLSCNAEIRTDEKSDVLVIPISALVIREVYLDEAGKILGPVTPETNMEKSGTGAEIQAAPKDSTETKPKANEDEKKKEEREGVFIKLDDDTARFRPVTTGITGEIEIEIVEGLSEGDAVITGPYKTLRLLQDGNKVKATSSTGTEVKK